MAGAAFAVAATLRGAGINVMVVERSGKAAAS
jgi:2-polyprenyl-6-methoxyphenol hydroxylase-like FAD-dependent oxidoreductase